MEGQEEGVKELDWRRLEVGLNLAGNLGASHAILTGKADPLQENIDYLCLLVERCRKHIPLVDIHTNGFMFQKRCGEDYAKQLVEAGLTMVTLSVACEDIHINERIMGFAQYIGDIIPMLVGQGLLVRCSLVLCKAGVRSAHGVFRYVEAMGSHGAKMVVVRELWTPNPKRCDPWVLENKVDLAEVEKEWRDYLKVPVLCIQERDPLPWGQPVYVVGSNTDPDWGVNVTFARCDDASRGGFLKSIVHKPDGHGYRNWDHPGDILY